MSLTDIIKLNIRGKLVTIARSTLVSDTTSVLARMFDPQQLLTSTNLVDGGHFIHSDPECFQVLLNWLAYRKMLLPKNLTSDAVSAVAEFYGLLELCKELEGVCRKTLSKLEFVKLSEFLSG